MANEKRIKVESGALFVDGGHATPLLIEQADALRAEIALADAAREALGDVELADLPEGVRLRLTLDPRFECPEGWEYRSIGGWHAEPGWLAYPMEVRPIPKPPAPKTERVPWWECVDRVFAGDGRPIIGSIRVTAEDVRLFDPKGAYIADPELDGTVEVLVEGDES